MSQICCAGAGEVARMARSRACFWRCVRAESHFSRRRLRARRETFLVHLIELRTGYSEPVKGRRPAPVKCQIRGSKPKRRI